MTATDIAQYISDAIALALVARLLQLRLHGVYRVFCAYLLFDLFSSAVFFVSRYMHHPHLEYRWAWMMLRPIAWVLSLWMVYALVSAILVGVPGILRLSHKILNAVFVLALVIALLTAGPEYSASGLAASMISGNRLMAVVFVMERVISMAVLLILFATMAFILWFPVRMSRNLAVFSIGFVLLFATRTGLLLAHTYTHASPRLLSNITSFALAGCCAYLLIVINRAGETKPVRIGHSWGPAEQERLEGQLQAMNDALLRASRR